MSDDHEAEIARLHALVLAIADRVERQAMLLASNAERKEPTVKPEPTPETA